MRYAAFFRGINVGGKNIVKMADLKKLFFDLGFQDVKTYIQSGNVIFSSDCEKSLLTVKIEGAFTKQFGFQSPAILRSSAELAAILGTQPFSAAEIQQAAEENPDVEHLYVYLSDTPIDSEKIKQAYSDYDSKDKLHAAEYEIYLLCCQSVKDSKLAAQLSKLPQTFTARNLKTMNKIYALL